MGRNGTKYSFVFRPAKRESLPLFIGLAGGTGSGKTFSALTMARGIVGPNGKIAAGDTEGRRMSQYAGLFGGFEVTDIKPPFRPERFESLVKAAEDKGFDCLIVDSMSHEWTGEGGVLEWHDEELDRFAGNDEAARGRNNMRAWIAPKTAHKAMVQSFLQRRIPIIFCFRAEERVKIEKDGKPVRIGWQPLCDQRFMYELTVMLTFTSDRPGAINWKQPHKIIEPHRGYLPDGRLVSTDMGALVASWARGAPDKVAQNVSALVARMQEQSESVAVDAILEEPEVKRRLSWLQENRPGEYDRIQYAAKERKLQLSGNEA